MTREERKLALYCLKANSDYHSEVCEECTKYPNCDHMGQDDVIETIIKALEQEPCDDCISRQAVLNLVVANHTELSGVNVVMYSPLCKDIKQLPPVTPQPKAGHWVRWYEQKENDWYIDNIPHCKCSECGKEYDSHSSQFIKYCNECGAKMEVEE